MQKWLCFFPWLQREPSPSPTPHPPTPTAPHSFPSPPYPPSLLRRRRPDAFGCPAPLPTPALLRQSLRLACMTYTLDIVPWLENGWRDFSFQIDDTLESGQSRISTRQDEDFQHLAELERMRRAQQALNSRNPLTRMLAALRQREASDTVKAVCMMHPLPEGRHLLAIGFMGTGRQLYEWVSNMRMGQEDGFHQGFYQLCRRFEAEMENIQFPATARALGLDTLTLSHVLTDLQRPDSRFRLWMAGHSQGGAVMQIFTHRLLHVYHVQAAHVCGVGFASPTVAAPGLCLRPYDYPLWHVRNGDDVIGRVGAAAHLGRCLDFQPDGAFRSRSYQWSLLPANGECRRWVMPLLASMRDNASTLLILTALVLCVAQEKGEDVLTAFAERYRYLPGLDRLMPAASGRAQGLLQQLANRQKRLYREQTGQEMDGAALMECVESLRPHVRRTPLRRMLSVLAECLLQPHQLCENDPSQPGAYSLIVQEYAGRLRVSRWEVRCGRTVHRLAAPAHLARSGGGRRTPMGKARLRR